MFESIKAATGANIRTKVFSMFVAQAQDNLERLIEEIGQDGSEVKALAHAMKSNWTSAGAKRMAALCKQVERSAADRVRIEPSSFDELRVTLTIDDGLVTAARLSRRRSDQFAIEVARNG